MFNQSKTAKKEPAKHYDQMLGEKTKPHKFTPKNPGNYDWLLQKEEHRAKDTDVPWEKQLGAARTGDDHPGTIESKFDKNKDVYNLRRTDKAYGSRLLTVQQVAEAHDQKHYEAIRSAESAQDKETAFWDKYVGVDVTDEMKKKMPTNRQKSQLQNHPDRFKNLHKTMPINEKMQDDAKTLKKEDKIYEMVTASLKDADAMIFTLFGKAAFEKRELTAEETQQLDDINSAKARLLAFLDGKLKQHFLVTEKKDDKEALTVWERSLKKDAEGKLAVDDKALEPFSTADDAKKAFPNLIVD